VISLRNAFILLLIVILGCSCSKSGEEQIDLETLPDLNGKSVVMIIASRDFRDEELQEPESILEQKGAQVTIACSALGEVTGMKGMKVKPDILLDQVNVEDYDAVIFIGGSGAKEYWNDSKTHSIARETVAADKVLGAICIAPVTLANAGVLNGKKATVYSSEKGKLEAAGADYTGADVQVDGKIITANGPEAAARFGEAIARALGES
jgi:protease I